MIASMTGFGKADLIEENTKLSLEITSVNSRFLEFQFRLPKFITALESKLKEMIAQKISRGKISYTLIWEDQSPVTNYVKLNEEVSDIYFSILKKLQKKYKLSSVIRAENFLSLPDLIKFEKEDFPEEKAWSLISKVTEQALNDLNKSRFQEGKRLAFDLKHRIGNLQVVIKEVEKLSDLNVQSYREKLRQRIKALLVEPVVDDNRIALEVTLMAERSDVTEECIRFLSHGQQFLESLEESAPVGKKLTFILQELNRETNTIGAKAAFAEISKKVIYLKEEIEKLREQVQNLE